MPAKNITLEFDASGVRREHAQAERSPLERVGAPVAEMARALARYEDALLAGRAGAERDAAVDLASRFVERGTDLDLAVRLARRALELGDDPALRRTLASWLVAIGDLGDAASDFRASIGVSPTARELVQAASLAARAGDDERAASWLRHASTCDPSDPVPRELLASFGGAGAGVVSPEEAAHALVEAARLRADRGDRASAIDDAARAVALAPETPDVRRLLANWLRDDGREHAASSVEQGGRLGADESSAYARDPVTLARLALERAPSASHYAELAHAYDDLGDRRRAHEWTERALALAPRDLEAMQATLRRGRLTTLPDVVARSIATVIAIPMPLGALAPDLIDSLGALLRDDPMAALRTARRVLDALGPTESLSTGLVRLADRAGDAALAATVLERRVAATPEAALPNLLDLARRRIAAGDVDGAARELVRALDAGASPEVVEPIVESMRPSDARTSDGRLFVAETRARVLESHVARWPDADEATRAPAVAALRRLGALRWDLAEDARGAEESLFAAASVRAPAHRSEGLEQYVADLCELLGPTRALSLACDRARAAVSVRKVDAARLFGAIARVAAPWGCDLEAIEAAVVAVELMPSEPDVLTVLEDCAVRVEGADEALDRAYRALAAGALGIYGRRAAHYRAARRLERHGARDRARHHATEALSAVPGDAGVWDVIARLVDPERGSDEVFQTIARLARAAPDGERTLWLDRAVHAAGTHADGRRRVVELLVDVVARRADVATVRRLVALACDEADLAPHADRLASAFDAQRRSLEGPDGARIAVALARLLTRADRREAALGMLELAFELDGDVEVYDALADEAADFARAPQRAAATLAWIDRRMIERHAIVGGGLLRFAGALAEVLGDGPRSETYSRRALAVASNVEPTEAAPSSYVDLFADEANDELDASERLDRLRPAGLAREAMPDAHAHDEAPVSVPPPSIGAVLSHRAPPTAVRPLPPEPDADATAELRDLFHRIASTPDLATQRALRLHRARLLAERLGRPTDARRELADLLVRHPDDAEILETLTELHARASRIHEARSLVPSTSSTLVSAPTPTSPPTPAPTLSPAPAVEGLVEVYLASGVGTPREAHALLAELPPLHPSLDASTAELVGFLRAEALDVVSGRSAGLVELERLDGELGPRPLLAVGLAERYARAGRFEAAALRFRQALAGDLRGLRRPDRVALAGVDAALAVEDAVAARHFLERVGDDPGHAPALERRRRELATLDPQLDVAIPAAESLLAEVSGLPRARLAWRLARRLATYDLAAALPHYESAMSGARRDPRLLEQIRADVVALTARASIPPATVRSEPNPHPSGPPFDEGAEAARVDAPPNRPTLVLDDDDDDEPAEAVPERATSTIVHDSELASPESKPATDVTVSGADDESHPDASEPVGPMIPLDAAQADRARARFPAETERSLLEAMLRGDDRARRDLLAALAPNPGRSDDVLFVHELACELRPTDRASTQAYLAAARRLNQPAQVRALEHVLEGTTPPPLAAQPVDPAVVEAVLFAELASVDTEILQLLWEAGLEHRSLASFGLPAEAQAPLGLVGDPGARFTSLAKRLGSPRPMFVAATWPPRVDAVVPPGQLANHVRVLLTPQPSVLTRAANQEAFDPSAFFAYALATCSPAFVLAAHAPAARVERLWSATMAAFGPVTPREPGQRTSSAAAFEAEVVRLAAELWKVVGPKAERRLRELCDGGDRSLPTARCAARRAGLRAALYASGDLRATLALAASVLGTTLTEIELGGGMRHAAANHPELADLLRIACRADYARLRFTASGADAGV